MKTTTFFSYHLSILLAFLLTTTLSFGQWNAIANYPAGPSYSLASFVIGNKAYFGGGNPSLSSFYEYDIGSDTWTQKAGIGGGLNRASPIRFAINGKGYIGGGAESAVGVGPTFYEYDPASDQWTKKADFPGGDRHSAFYAAAGGKGYVIAGNGTGNSPTAEVWEYDPAADSWTQKTSFPGGNAYWPAGFVVQNKIYVGTGSVSGVGLVDFYQYDPATDTWTPKANFPGAVRSTATGFSVGLFGYIGAGISEDFTTNYNDFYEYNVVSDTWTAMSSLSYPSNSTAWCSGVVVGNDVIFGTGAASSGGIVPDDKMYKATINNPVGVEEQQQLGEDVQIAPNPAQQQIQLSYTLTAANAVEIQLSNLSGQTVKTILTEGRTAGVHQEQIDISDLSNGIYHCTIKAGNSIQYLKFSVVN